MNDGSPPEQLNHKEIHELFESCTEDHLKYVVVSKTKSRQIVKDAPVQRLVIKTQLKTIQVEGQEDPIPYYDTRFGVPPAADGPVVKAILKTYGSIIQKPTKDKPADDADDDEIDTEQL
jgi:hypothetical protein